MSNPTIHIENGGKLGQLKALLYLLQTNLEEFKNDVDSSYELLKIGEKTSLTKRLEQAIKNPAEDFFNYSNNIDVKVSEILHRIILGYFKRNKNSIERVFKTNKNLNDLHYSIVLKKDNISNRAMFFDFLNKLDLNYLNQKHNIYFQFIPSHLVDKINFEKELPLS